MNKIFKIIWNATTQTWVVVSELTRAHTKRASATVATAVLATALSATVQASGGISGGEGNIAPSDLGTDYYFRVTTTNTGEENDTDHYKGCPNGNVDSACPNTEMNIGVLESSKEPKQENTDYSRLVLEGDKGIRLKKDEGGYHKITFDAIVKADKGSNAISITQPVEGKDAGHTIIKSEIKSGSADKIKVTSENGVTTITWVGGAAGGTNAGGAWKAVAAASGTGEVDPASPTAEEISAGDTVTFKAGNNLKIKQKNKNFTYSLKEELTGLTRITLGNTANGGTTVIDKDGLTITPANAGANNANTISVTTSGISAGNKEITNVASGLSKYTNGNEAKKELVDLSGATTNTVGATTPTDLAKKLPL